MYLNSYTGASSIVNVNNGWFNQNGFKPENNNEYQTIYNNKNNNSPTDFWNNVFQNIQPISTESNFIPNQYSSNKLPAYNQGSLPQPYPPMNSNLIQDSPQEPIESIVIGQNTPPPVKINTPNPRPSSPMIQNQLKPLVPSKNSQSDFIESIPIQNSKPARVSSTLNPKIQIQQALIQMSSSKPMHYMTNLESNSLLLKPVDNQSQGLKTTSISRKPTSSVPTKIHVPTSAQNSLILKPAKNPFQVLEESFEILPPVTVLSKNLANQSTQPKNSSFITEKNQTEPSHDSFKTHMFQETSVLFKPKNQSNISVQNQSILNSATRTFDQIEDKSILPPISAIKKISSLINKDKIP